MNRLLSLAVLIIPALLHADTEVATTYYYIDSQDGNDLNTGRSAATAWKSHTKAQQTKLLPGDVVMFKRGSQFSGPLYDIVYTAFPGILFRNNLYIGTEQCFHGSPYKIESQVDAQDNWFWNVDASPKSDGDPKLLDIDGEDFRLRSDSPLRGKGQNLSEYYSADFAGNPLPKTGVWDIGAFHHAKLGANTTAGARGR